MRFFYEAEQTLSPATGGPMLTLRPLIPIQVGGPRGAEIFQALVDTGSDNTMFPKSFAEMFGVATFPGRGPAMQALGGQRLPTVFGEVTFELQQGNETLSWSTRVQFFEFASPEEEAFILGQIGFLEYFTAIFDGDEGTLTLTPNKRRPTA